MFINLIICLIIWLFYHTACSLSSLILCGKSPYIRYRLYSVQYSNILVAIYPIQTVQYSNILVAVYTKCNNSPLYTICLNIQQKWPSASLSQESHSRFGDSISLCCTLLKIYFNIPAHARSKIKTIMYAYYSYLLFSSS